MAAMLFRISLTAWRKLCRPLCQGASRHPRNDKISSDILAPDMRNNKEQAFVHEDGETEEDSCAFGVVFSRADTPDCGFMRFCNVHPFLPLDVPICNGYLEDMSLDPDEPRRARPYIARPFLAQMLVYGAIPDVSTFSILIKSYCKDFRLTYQHVVDVVFTQMKALEVNGDELFYKILMDGVCARFGPNAGYQLLEKLKLCKDIEMSPTCYDELVAQFTKRKVTKI